MKLRECEIEMIMEIIFLIIVKRFQVHCNKQLEKCIQKERILTRMIHLLSLRDYLGHPKRAAQR